MQRDLVSRWTTTHWAVLVLAAALSVNGCSCGDDDAGTPDGGGGGVDSGGDDGGGESDGGAPDDGAIPADGETPVDGEVPTDGSTAPGPVMCQSHLYLCGNGMDDDGDGLIDSFDPDCLGPCDNNEEGFDLLISGGDTPTCLRDCYYDQDQGPGNDQCAWDTRCDPLSPDPRPMCAYTDPRPPSAQCPDPQAEMCHTFCGPLTPNGCDCFGCCELPAGSGTFVFLGSRDSAGMGTCTLERANAGDTDACHPCTPVGDCLNDCGPCELCLGRTELPPECLTPSDGGVPPVDSSVPPVDGGTPSLRCPDGRQPCGLSSDPLCPAGYYCVTGCCTFFG